MFTVFFTSHWAVFNVAWSDEYDSHFLISSPLTSSFYPSLSSLLLHSSPHVHISVPPLSPFDPSILILSVRSILLLQPL